MGKTVISMEIGEKQTRIVVLKLHKTKQRVKKALIFDTPEGMIEDGYITDCDGFAQMLLPRLREKKIRTGAIVFTLASNRIINREITVEAVQNGKIKKLVDEEAQDYFPMDISEHGVAYHIIEKDTEKKQSRLMLYAVPDTLLQNYYRLARKLHCSVASIDCIGNSLYQWLRRSTFEDVSLVIQINETKSAITVFRQKVMGIQRTLNYGLAAIADGLWESGELEAVPDRAAALELMRREPVLAEAMEAGRREHWQEDLLEGARMFTGNVARVMEYYTTKNPGVSVQRIYITGEGARVAGMQELLAEELQIPVEVFNVTEQVTFSEDAIEEQKDGFALFACFGAVVKPLGLRTFRHIIWEKILGAIATVGVLALAVAGVFVYLLSEVHGEIDREEARKAALAQQITVLEDIEQLAEVCGVGERSLAAAKEAEKLTRQVTEQLPEVLEALEQVLPKRAMLYSMSVNDAALTMNFSTVTKEEAAEVLLQLKQLPYLSGVQLTGITESENTATQTSQVAFTINCTLVEVEEETEVQQDEEE